jgi:putative membrane protein
MKYQAYTDNDLTLRDALAFDRTILANERTLLSYLRSAMALLAVGVTLIKFFPQDKILNLSGIVMFILGVIVVILGLFRFFKVRKSLKLLSFKATE